MKRILVIGLIALTACGMDDGRSQPIHDPTWTIIRDPFGGKHACMYVDGERGVTMYCVKEPPAAERVWSTP